MAEIEITIEHEAGLHARPLAQFVKKVKEFDADVLVWNLTRKSGPAAGNSPLKLMLLAISQGHQMRIEATGPQAEDAIQALESLIANNFATE